MHEAESAKSSVSGREPSRAREEITRLHFFSTAGKFWTGARRMMATIVDYAPEDRTARRGRRGGSPRHLCASSSPRLRIGDEEALVAAEAHDNGRLPFSDSCRRVGTASPATSEYSRRGAAALTCGRESKYGDCAIGLARLPENDRNRRGHQSGAARSNRNARQVVEAVAICWTIPRRSRIVERGSAFGSKKGRGRIAPWKFSASATRFTA